MKKFVALHPNVGPKFIELQVLMIVASATLMHAPTVVRIDSSSLNA